MQTSLFKMITVSDWDVTESEILAVSWPRDMADYKTAGVRYIWYSMVLLTQG